MSSDAKSASALVTQLIRGMDWCRRRLYGLRLLPHIVDPHQDAKRGNGGAKGQRHDARPITCDAEHAAGEDKEIGSQQTASEHSAGTAAESRDDDAPSWAKEEGDANLDGLPCELPTEPHQNREYNAA